MKSDDMWYIWGFMIFALLFMLLAPFRDILAYSLFIYYIARPVYKVLNRITKMPSLSAIVALAFIIIPISYILSYTVTLAAGEIGGYLNSMPAEQKAEYTGIIIERLNLGEFSDVSWNSITQYIGAENTGKVIDILNKSASFVFGLLEFIFYLALMFFISFYLLRDGRELKESIIDRFFADEDYAKHYFKATDEALSRIFFGNILNAMITGLLALLTYTVFNAYSPAYLKIPYPALLAILTGVASLIPMVGVKLVWVPTTIYLFVISYFQSTVIEDLLFIGLFLVAVNVIVDMLPDFALRPFVTAKGYHTGAMMFAYIFGPIVFGISGIFLGPMIFIFITNYVKIIVPVLNRANRHH